MTLWPSVAIALSECVAVNVEKMNRLNRVRLRVSDVMCSASHMEKLQPKGE